MDNITEIILGAMIGALLSWIVSLLLDQKDKEFEMKRMIYNDLIANLNDAKEIIRRYVNELSKLNIAVQTTKTEPKEVINYDLYSLFELYHEFIKKRNWCLLYSKMYQAKANDKKLKWKYKLTRKENKYERFVEYLINCNTHFHKDTIYLHNNYFELHELLSQYQGLNVTSNEELNLLKSKVFQVIGQFTTNELQIIKIDELEILEFVADAFVDVL